MRRGALLAVLVALVAVPGAQANGDPASDVLITQQVFLPFEAPISASAKDELTKTVASANAHGYKIRVAVIAFTGDLGTAVSLWRHPDDYGKFLGSELAFVYRNRLLIAMPSGFGFYHGRKPVAKERAVIAKVQPGKTPTALTESTTDAVRALAAADGVVLPKVSTGGRDWRDRIIIAGVGLLGLLVIFFPVRRLRKGGRSPSPADHTPEPD
jgi:hypothetical protein